MSNGDNLQRDSLRKFARDKHATPVQKELAELKIAYSEESKLLTGYIHKLVHVKRIFPRHLPTQASGRWSTFDPPVTNWPRECVNTACTQSEHEWTDQCWSVRDILSADSDEVLVTFDHDNIEGRIHDLIVNDTEALTAHAHGYDLHTITTCNIFGYDYPVNLVNPHTSTEDAPWRRKYRWQGKDTKQRVLAKNFNHGSKYTKTWRFVYRIQGIEKYGVVYSELGKLARAYIESKAEPWQRKLRMMEQIKRERFARSLYGFRRVFYDSSEETAREGMSHMISGTVSDYNNETLTMLHTQYGDGVRLLNNSHDGNKLAFKVAMLAQRYGVDNDTWKTAFMKDLKGVIERDIEYQSRHITLTASVKVYG